jgi:hypothetical protein
MDLDDAIAPAMCTCRLAEVLGVDRIATFLAPFGFGALWHRYQRPRILPAR